MMPEEPTTPDLEELGRRAFEALSRRDLDIDTASKPVRGFEGGAALVLRLEPGHLFLLALEADASQDPLPPVLNDLDPSVPTTTGRKTPTNRP